MDENDCPDYKRFFTLKGNERKMEIQRLKGKICNKNPNRLCCKVTKHAEAAEWCMTGLNNDLPSYLPPADQCGVCCVGSSGMVRGENASLGEFPWAALLGTEIVVKDYNKEKKIWSWDVRKWVNMTEMVYHWDTHTHTQPWTYRSIIYTGCPTILYPLLFFEFLGFLGV